MQFPCAAATATSTDDDFSVPPAVTVAVNLYVPNALIDWPPDTPHLHFQVMRLNPRHRDWWNGTPVGVRQFMTETGKAVE